MRSLEALKRLMFKATHRLAGLTIGAVASAGLLAGAAQAEPALWVVKDKDSTIYLFGSVHLLKPDAKWLTPKIEKALDSSQDLTLEIANADDQAAALPLIQQYGMDVAHPLSGKLSPEDNTALDAAYKDAGLPPKALDVFKPWMAGLTFTVVPIQKAGYDPKAGVEAVLKARAVAHNEPVLGFETIEQQIRYFADMPEPKQISFLRETLKDAPKAAQELDQVEHAWEAGDVDTIAKVLNEGMKQDDPELYDLLLVKRNQGFARQIAEKLKGKGVSFVAVGAAHLAGPDSVQAQLAKMGIKAERF